MNIVILAAGKGTRMKSNKPKVLHELAGKPMLQHVVDSAMSLANAKLYVVIGHGGEQVQAYFAKFPQYENIQWVWQREQKGTGHAVQQAVEIIDNDEPVVVLYGDVPLISVEKIQQVAEVAEKNTALITAEFAQPGALGRIIRNDNGKVIAIREFKDANDNERAIKEINSGIMAVPGKELKQYLAQLNNNNAQGEYYLTDVIEMSVAQSKPVEAIVTDDVDEIAGVNSLLDLQNLERTYQQRQAEKLLAAGCYINDIKRFDIRGSLSHGVDCRIDVNCVIEGECQLGDNVSIAANVYLKNVSIDDNTHIAANSVLEDAQVGKACNIGPFARLRPGSDLDDETRVGNFVEIKNAKLKQGAKVNHLSYIGDADIGKQVNVGAGVITCNYDGANKHKTIIGDNAFIGSDCQLVAPVEIGAGATIAAGTTVYKDAPSDKLTLNPKSMQQIDGWHRPKTK